MIVPFWLIWPFCDWQNYVFKKFRNHFCLISTEHTIHLAQLIHLVFCTRRTTAKFETNETNSKGTIPYHHSQNQLHEFAWVSMWFSYGFLQWVNFFAVIVEEDIGYSLPKLKYFSQVESSHLLQLKANACINAHRQCSYASQHSLNCYFILESFQVLADMINQFPSLLDSSRFIFIPGPQDPGPGNILPRYIWIISNLNTNCQNE